MKRLGGSRGAAGALAGVALALAGCGGGGHGHHHPRVRRAGVSSTRCRAPERRLVDLTQRVHDAAPRPPGVDAFRLQAAGGRTVATLDLAIGTHVRTPGGPDALTLAPRKLAAARIDLRERAKATPDTKLGPNDIVDWEAVHGPLPPQSIVVVDTGWGERFERAATYLNRDPQGAAHFPGVTAAAVKLLAEREVAAIGVDVLVLDGGASLADGRAPARDAARAAGMTVVLNVARLDALPEVGAEVMVAPLSLHGVDHAPARVLALVPPSPKP